MNPQETFNLAVQHHRESDLARAEALYRLVLAAEPHHADALHLLGMVFYQGGQYNPAAELINRAIAANPSQAIYHGNLGLVRIAQGKLTDAVTLLRHALSLHPNDPTTLCNLGEALCQLGNLKEAAEFLRRASEIRPSMADAHYNLAHTLWALGKPDESVAAYRHAIAWRPSDPRAFVNLANSLMAMGQCAEALDYYRQASNLQPRDADLASNCIFAMHFLSEFDAPRLLRELTAWDRRFGQAPARPIHARITDRSHDRRLRIGYISADFSEHVVGRCMLALPREHDREQMEIICYANSARADSITRSLRSQAKAWRNISALDDESAAAIIADDHIDILVDLSLHSAGNRLTLFAHKAAPVQVSYLGYCGGTGMAAMDYRLSDPHLDPTDDDLRWYTEKTVRLPRTYWCYEPHRPSPPVVPPPALAAGHITFGCLNNFAKVSPATLDAWAQILASVPNSRLVIHAPLGSYLDSVRQRFAPAGAAGRIEFVGKQNTPQYLRTYQRIDIALDPFPYGGGITTCDALWMGVAVITLSGQTAVGRGGRSILSNIGLARYVAATPADYVRLAAELAGDLSQLTELRLSMRQRLEQSPLRDARQFARDVEAAYRGMWIRWCETP